MPGGAQYQNFSGNKRLHESCFSLFFKEMRLMWHLDEARDRYDRSIYR